MTFRVQHSIIQTAGSTQSRIDLRPYMLISESSGNGPYLDTIKANAIRINTPSGGNNMRFKLGDISVAATATDGAVMAPGSSELFELPPHVTHISVIRDGAADVVTSIDIGSNR